jgi:hypothetical protein
VAMSSSSDTDDDLPGLVDAKDSDDDEVLSLDQLRQSVMSNKQMIRSNGLQQAIAHADEKRKAGNARIKSDPAGAAAKYEEAMGELWPFESKTEALWPLILNLSNHAHASNQSRSYDDAIESCDDGLMLLARHGHLFPAGDRVNLEAKLELRKKAALDALASADEAAASQATDAARADEAAARERATAEAEAAKAQARAEAEAAEALQRERERAEREAEKAEAERLEAERRAAEERMALEERIAAEKAAVAEQIAAKVARERAAREKKAAERAAAEQQALERRAAAAKAEAERLAEARAREDRLAAERAAAREAKKLEDARVKAERRARREIKAAEKAAVIAGEAERVERERQQALANNEWAEQQIREREAAALREAEEAEEVEIAENVSRRAAREEAALAEQEKRDIERAKQLSLADAQTDDGGSTSAAPLPTWAKPQIEASDHCLICLEGPDDDDDKAVPRVLLHPCLVCNIILHMACTKEFKLDCKKKGKQPRCPQCQALDFKTAA